jgi:hypothetical protein
MTANRAGLIGTNIVHLLVILSGCLVGSTASAWASIEGHSTFSADLVKDKQAAKKMTWAEPEHFRVDAKGLGWGKKGDGGSREFSLQTEPLGLGLSWRPTTYASITATLAGDFNPGDLYVRYSADRKHWTTWQCLHRDGTQPHVFQGLVSVPNRERNRYDELRMTFRRSKDVVWCCDEEAFAQELTKDDPAFFQKSTPFVGYVQFLYETRLRAGDRIESINIGAVWSVGGKSVLPKDPKVQEDRDGPWRFQVR